MIEENLITFTEIKDSLHWTRAIYRPNKSPGPLPSFHQRPLIWVSVSGLDLKNTTAFDPICFPFFSKNPKKEILSSPPSKAKREDEERS